jgi:DNA/RNA endonuclease G (NUC1)
MFRSLRLERISPPVRRLLAISLLLAALIGTTLYSLPPSGEAATTDLIFSEYIEGSSNNKALEIYNGTGAAVPLTGYTIEMYFNGATTNPFIITLSGTVANSGTFVIAPTNANATILAAANQQAGSAWFNGDDAVLLKKNGVIIDSIGQFGSDPGTEWGTGFTSTADNTIRRKSTICAGDTVANDAFNPATEWDGFAQDTFSGLGSHTANCGVTPTPTPTPTPSPTPTPTPTPTPSPTPTPVPPGSVVISQIYAGGGNAGATLKNDFIEIFNRSTNVVNVTGWTVQYLSATGSGTWATTTLSGSIPPGGYYLVQEAQGTGGSDNLPAPDAIGTIPMGAGAGKIALVSSSTALSGCPSGGNIVDLVGYGTTATCSEGNNPTANLGNTLAAIRTHGGCKDTDNNGVDFKVGSPSPRNSSNSLHICPIGDLEPEVYTTTPGDGTTSIPLTTDITVQFDEPVTVTGNWYTISCATSGIHTATVTGGPTTFTLNPDGDFVALEQCTVTILASQVTDQDVNDPPDNMTADYSFSFLTGHDPQVHLTMGNPSNAMPDAVNSQDNYLMEKDQYTISYNRSKATPNWVSWQLDQTWLGSIDRQDDFRADNTLPLDWYHVQGSDFQFAKYGFDRGHMTPSADRTASIEDNSATFLMTNMIPQASGNNQGPWNNLEGYIRTQIAGGNRAYIVSGPAGVGGVSTTGTWNTIETPTGGTITVPAFTWKVVILVPAAGGNDVSKVNNSTRTLAVIMPNKDNIRPDDWKKYLATVDQVEALTGYDFFSNVSAEIQSVIESRLDVINDTAPAAANKTASVAEDSSVEVTLSATDFNINNVLSFTPSSPLHGQLSNMGAPSCALLVSPDPDAGKVRCTVTATYMPNADYFGPDSFTYTVNDAGLDSAPATVAITVTEVNDAPTAGSDSKTATEDTPLTFAASDLSVNDGFGPTNETGQNLTVTYVAPTADTHGTVALDAGQITYTPAANYNGPAAFTYRVCDDGTTGGLSDSKCDESTVNVTVEAVNDVPTADAQTVNTDEDTPANIVLTGSDVETSESGLDFTVTSGPAHGTLSGMGANLLYTPAANYNGPDSFQFTITDTGDGTAQALTSAPATVSINVISINDTPTLSNVPANPTIDELNAYSFTATASDVDAGQTLTFSLIGAPAGATIDPNTGQFTWTPTEAQGGTGSPFNFKVAVSDGVVTVEQNISISVNEVNQAPVLNPVGDKTVILGNNLTFNATATDGDLPAQGLTFSLTGAVPAGAVISSAGAFSWTPTAAQAGNTYTFNVRVTDNGSPNKFAEETIHVGVAYTWTNLLDPINTDGSSIFKLGRTIPLKFKLTGASSGLTSAVAKVYLAKVSGGVVGTVLEAESTSAASSGNTFRYDASGDQYIFNLSTSGLTAGTYQLSVDFGDGVLHTLTFGLK